uniref:Major facilitator superfamily (MFS) profile domain-containing protein n=1 Tax=Mucochytrium quahogii TaxID=96639 RepID=A0A7S2WF51_9STRA|mmetsp:Transcript_20144/g.33278  ORF Transcript_20144/g.33278 Transcript_20144/m.33278 type:complete len:486 (+) Transcript_20144:62-1519(+)
MSFRRLSPAGAGPGHGAANGEVFEDRTLALQDDQDEEYTPRWCKLTVINRLVLCFFSGDDGYIKMNLGQWNTMFTVCVISVFSGFDWEVLPMAIKQIQDGLGLAEGDLGYLNGVVKLGTLGAFVVSVYADAFGRRNALLLSAFMFAGFSFATSFAQSPWQFAGLQFVARLFIEAKSTLCNTLLLEQLSKRNRGLGLGVYQAMTAVGGGLAFIAYGIVGEMKDGWRILYRVAIVQLFFLYYFVKRLPESQRFSSERKGVRQVLYSLFKHYPRRLIAATTINILNGFAFAPGDLLKTKFMQEKHGYRPYQVSIMVLVSGIFAFVSFSIAGRMSDRYGRKLFILTFMTVSIFGVIGFYQAPGNAVILFYFIQLQAGFVLMVVSNAYFGECFPTSSRATAQSFLKVVSVASGIGSLALEGFLYEHVHDSHWDLVSMFCLIGLPSPIILYICLPETSGVDLDEVSPEVGPEKPSLELSSSVDFVASYGEP